MPDAQSNPGELREALRSYDLSRGQQFLMLVLNYVPLVHVAVVVLAATLLPWSWPVRLPAVLVVLYIVPALLGRLVLAFRPVTRPRIGIGTRDYFTWWGVLNLQVLFCRLPALEACLRIVPGAYNAWLRLWGARIGRYTYWGAGTQILDRSFLRIGQGVVFGAGVRISPHVVARNADGELELWLAPVTIGDRVMIGAHSLLAGGTTIADDECTRARLMSAPFSHWKGGKRTNCFPAAESAEPIAPPPTAASGEADE